MHHTANIALAIDEFAGPVPLPMNGWHLNTLRYKSIHVNSGVILHKWWAFVTSLQYAQQ